MSNSLPARAGVVLSTHQKPCKIFKPDTMAQRGAKLRQSEDLNKKGICGARSVKKHSKIINFKHGTLIDFTVALPTFLLI
jgi:hypothetical protein